MSESMHDINERQRPQDRKQNALRRRFESLLGEGYDPGWLEPLTASAALIDEQADEIERLRAGVGHWREANRTSLTAGDVLKDEVVRLTAENDWLRAYTAQSAKACVYCGLGADEQGHCERGFPGCARGDDQMLCREVGVALERDELRAEVVSLREQIAALESREVCTAAHENTETCGYCQRDALAQDAARYRWLRASTLRTTGLPAICIISYDGYHIRIAHDEADKRIDAAMREGGT